MGEIIAEFAHMHHLEHREMRDEIFNGWIFTFINPRTNYKWSFIIRDIEVTESNIWPEELIKYRLDKAPRELFDSFRWR